MNDTNIFKYVIPAAPTRISHYWLRWPGHSEPILIPCCSLNKLFPIRKSLHKSICMIALVIGSAFGIFFAGESTSTGITVQEAIIQLNGEYQDRLEEIENNITHDRQEIVSNDGSYAIAWQDVLAVFAARTSGAEDGASVAFIDEDNLDRLREIMWDMNEVDYRTDTNTSEVEIADDEGNTTTTSVTETVLTIELTHKTAEEMRTVYAFNDRQNEYLTLLSGEGTAELWNQLLGGFASGGGEVMAPAGGWQPTGSLVSPYICSKNQSLSISIVRNKLAKQNC